MSKVKNDLQQIALIYLIITLSGFLSWKFIAPENEIIRFLIADLVMTFVCFAFSLLKKNASVYDAYWSYIPFLFYLQLIYSHFDTVSTSQFIICLIVSLWSWRLSLNWARSWGGFSHVDWRYLDLAKKSAKAYPLVNFFGIHLFPTLMVFGGLLPLFFTFETAIFSLPILVLGCALSLSGIGFEHFADNELYKFRNTPNRNLEEVLQSGLWGRSRYPNYLGEILFWIGLAVIGQAFHAPLYTLTGSIAITLMILLVSIPMKEKRMLERRPAFKNYQQNVPMLIPKIIKKS